MGQAGLYIPANEESTIGIFFLIFLRILGMNNHLNKV